jgi:S1-C subfamily serine protease
MALMNGTILLRRCGLAAMAVTLALSSATCSGSGSSSSAATGTTSGSPADAANSLESQYQTVIKNVLPSVVQIVTDHGLGSGVVYDSAGDIVTNNHVVAGATTFQVTLASHPTAVTGRLVGTYPAGDLAIVRISGQPGLRPATFGDSSRTQIGQIVLAMGNPLGLSSSVTNGIVSAVGRTLTEPSSGDTPGATLPDSIQTSAAINPGNSGGALVNLRGEVIAIPTLNATNQEQGGSAAGIGFAVPSNTVKDVASQLIKNGKVTNTHRAALGIQATTVSDQSGTMSGVGVVSVTSGGPADKAGIRAGDIILDVQGHEVTDLQTLAGVLAGVDVGARVPVSVRRDSTTEKIEVTLGELPAN